MYGIIQHRLAPYIVAALISLIFSIWAALNVVVMNPDGICYLQSAAAMQHGLAFAAHLCGQAKWPFYSALIFGLVKCTHLSYLTAAFLLDGIFSLISVWAFIAIVGLGSHSKRLLWFAGLTILFAPEFNSLRIEIIRDHGFWAFYLLSLLFFIRYLKFPAKQSYSACLWAISLSIAGLFRIEGIVFLLLLPFSVIFDYRRTAMQRLRAYLQFNALTLSGAILLIAWLLWHPEQPLGRLTEIFFQLAHGIEQLTIAYQHSIHALATTVLNSYSARHASLLFFIMLIAWYLISVIENVSLLYVLIVIYGWWKKITALCSQTRLALWAYISVNVLITTIFLVENMFLSGRYLVALSLIWMVWIPFVLDYLCSYWSVRRWSFRMIIFLMVIFGFGAVLHLGHSKKYIREAGDWLAHYTQPEAKIYSNDYQLLYYADHLGNAIFTQGPLEENIQMILHGKWQQYTYLALRIHKDRTTDEDKLLQEMPVKPVKIFQNKRGDQIQIYHIQK